MPAPIEIAVAGVPISPGNPLPMGWMGSFRNIVGAATTVLKTGSGVLQSITVNKPVASSVITVYDNVAASGTKIATITQPTVLLYSQGTLVYGLWFTSGLTIVTSAADDITVVYA